MEKTKILFVHNDDFSREYPTPNQVLKDMYRTRGEVYDDYSKKLEFEIEFLEVGNRGVSVFMIMIDKDFNFNKHYELQACCDNRYYEMIPFKVLVNTIDLWKLRHIYREKVDRGCITFKMYYKACQNYSKALWCR